MKRRGADDPVFATSFLGPSGHFGIPEISRETLKLMNGVPLYSAEEVETD
jgi:hypothetical protein